MLEALSTSQYASWMTTSKWAYPTFLTAHGLGMAVVVGLTVMISLRVLGFPKQLPLAAYAKTVPFGIAGFVVNALSGTALFFGDPATLAANPSFIFKIVTIVIGIVLLRQFYVRTLKRAVACDVAGEPEYRPSALDKGLAVASILLWLIAVIVSGRLIAYLAPAPM